MASNLELKETTKKEIRSLLLSVPDRISVRQLDNDFNAFIGYRIPYRKIGYGNLEDFIRDIPDVVLVSYDKGQLMLKGLADESTGHIASLVARQKKSKKGRQGSSFRVPYGSRYSSYSKSASLNWRQKESHPLPSRLSLNNDVKPMPAECHVTVYPDKSDRFVTINQQASKTSTKSVEPLLTKSVELPPMTKPVDPRPVSTSSKAPLPHMLAISRGQIKDLMFAYPQGLKEEDFLQAYALRFGRYLDLQAVGCPSVHEMLLSMPDVIEFDNNNGESMIYGKCQRKENKVSNEVKENTSTTIPPNAMPQCVDGQENMKMNFFDGDNADGINSAFKTAVERVLMQHPNGIFSSKFSAEFKRVNNCELPVKQLGYQNVVELLAVIPDVVTVQRATASDWMLFSASTNKSKNASSCGDVLKYGAEDKLPAILDTLKIILKSYPEGLLESKVFEKYEELTGYNIERDMGFITKDFLYNYIDRVIEAEYVGEGRVKLMLVKEIVQQKPVPVQKQKLKVYNGVKIPEDAVVCGDLYLSPICPEVSSNYITVSLGHVYYPDDFYIMLLDYDEDLDDLMIELQRFYNSDSSKHYMVPSSMIQIGLACAAPFFDTVSRIEWHRCIITGLRDNLVQLFYVDYGSKGSVDRSQLRLLRDKYILLPCQAIRAKLSNIEPANGSWSVQSYHSMMALVCGKDLLCLVTEVSRDVISVCLCDTSQEEDVHINDHLVMEGLAVMSQPKVIEPVTLQNPIPNDPYSFSPEDNGTDDDDDDNYLSSPEDSALFSQFERIKVSSPKSGSENSNQRKGHLTKRVQLTSEYCMNLIRVYDKAYVVSTEVSALLWPDRDIRAMLRSQGSRWANCSKLVVTQEDYPDLMNGLYGEIPGLDKSKTLVLYELPVVVEILEAFHHPSEELKMAVQQQLDLFNPQDFYWTGENEPDFIESDVETVIEEKRLLQEEWESYTSKRSEILSQLMEMNKAVPGPSPEEITSCVEEMHAIEAQLKKIKVKLEKLQGGGSAQIGSNETSAENFRTNDATFARNFQIENSPTPNLDTDLGKISNNVQPVKPIFFGSAEKRREVKTNLVVPMKYASSVEEDKLPVSAQNQFLVPSQVNYSVLDQYQSQIPGVGHANYFSTGPSQAPLTSMSQSFNLQGTTLNLQSTNLPQAVSNISQPQFSMGSYGVQMPQMPSGANGSYTPALLSNLAAPFNTVPGANGFMQYLESLTGSNMGNAINNNIHYPGLPINVASSDNFPMLINYPTSMSYGGIPQNFLPQTMPQFQNVHASVSNNALSGALSSAPPQDFHNLYSSQR